MGKVVPPHLTGNGRGAGARQGAGPVVRTAVPADAQKRILSSLDVTVPEIQTRAGYGIALAGLVAFLLVIGAVYVALVGFLAWLLVWHVYQAFASLSQGPYFVFHVPMALLGGLLLLFLIKPVFFRRKPDQDAMIQLREEDEPLLFAFVGKLCEATGARRPAVIEVDCEPNAGARLLRLGVGGALGKELVLHIGLPLVAGMSVRQVAGVLAHELGHFRQRGGMKGALLIRLMVAFFAKVVFERDRWDEKLYRLRNGNSFGRVVFWAAAWLVEAARGVLWLMMVAGELLTCGVLRRMEYDADTLEAHVSGTREFLAVSKLLVFLSIASRRAHHDLSDAWEQRRLADDLPRLIVAHAKQLAEHRDDILKLIQTDKTTWFDTHPCHCDRVRNVEETGAQGVVACDLAAKYLFADFKALSRRASEALYRTIVGDGLDRGALIPTAELVEQRKGERESFKALSRFFRGGWAATRPILPTEEALEPVTAARQAKLIKELKDVRGEMLALAEGAAKSAEQFETSNSALIIARAKIAMTSILPLKGASKHLKTAVRERKTNEPLRLSSIRELIPFENAAKRRLTAGLRLAQLQAQSQTKARTQTQPQAQAQAQAQPSAAPSRSVAQLIKLCQSLQPHLLSVEKLREVALNIRVFMSVHDDEQPYPPLVRRVLDLSAEAVLLLRRLKESLLDKPYPFAHAKAGITIGAALVEQLATSKDPVAVYAVTTAAVDRFYDLVYRALAELTLHAEKVEQAIGLPALSDIAPREDKQAAEEELAERNRDARKYWLAYGARAAAGVAMLGVLIWLSISPPSMPSMGWPDAGARESERGYRPARFGPRRHFIPRRRLESVPVGPAYRMEGAPNLKEPVK